MVGTPAEIFSNGTIISFVTQCSQRWVNGGSSATAGRNLCARNRQRQIPAFVGFVDGSRALDSNLITGGHILGTVVLVGRIIENW